MTEPEPVEGSEDEIVWPAPAVTIRAVYDESGRLNSIQTEYQDVPPASDIARILAQFLMKSTSQLPSRNPGENVRDEQLTRKFQEVLGISEKPVECQATADILDGEEHPAHLCRRDYLHAGTHLCECGVRFGSYGEQT